jgi:hypothetical protein
VRGPSQDALIEEFSNSLSIKETEVMIAVVRNANPNAPPKEFGVAYRAYKLQAALVWHKKRAHPGKTLSLPLTGVAKPADTYSEDEGQESSASSEDDMQHVRKDVIETETGSLLFVSSGEQVLGWLHEVTG